VNAQIPESTGLCAGSRQAGGGDRDDLGKATSDPGRRGSQHCGYLSHLTSSIGAGGTVVPTTARIMENGLARLTSRDVYENSNARFVRLSIGSGIIALICPATDEIFSPDLDP
jgi:hypothetical protein